MSNIDSSKLIAFSENIEKLLKQDSKKHNISDTKENIKNTNDTLLKDEDNISTIDLIFDQKENEKTIPEIELENTNDKLLCGDDFNMGKEFDNIDMCIGEYEHDDKYLDIYGCKYEHSPKKSKITMLAEGEGTIKTDHKIDHHKNNLIGTAAEELQAKEETIGKKDKTNIFFSFFIGMQNGKFVGGLCLSDYAKQETIISDEVLYFHSANPDKFIAIFQVTKEGFDGREITVYGTTQNYSIPATLSVFSGARCGEDVTNDRICIGGTLSTGKIEIALPTKENNNK